MFRSTEVIHISSDEYLNMTTENCLLAFPITDLNILVRLSVLIKTDKAAETRIVSLN